MKIYTNVIRDEQGQGYNEVQAIVPGKLTLYLNVLGWCLTRKKKGKDLSVVFLVFHTPIITLLYLIGAGEC